MTLIMDAAARYALLNTLVRIVHVLDDIVWHQPNLARRIRAVRADLARFLWIMNTPPDAVHVERDLDRLVDTPGWQHPTQVLGAEGIDYEALLDAGRERLAGTRGRPRRRLERVLGKIDRAYRSAEETWAVQLCRLKERVEDLLEELPTA